MKYDVVVEFKWGRSLFFKAMLPSLSNSLFLTLTHSFIPNVKEAEYKQTLQKAQHLFRQQAFLFQLSLKEFWSVLWADSSWPAGEDQSLLWVNVPSEMLNTGKFAGVVY